MKFAEFIPKSYLVFKQGYSFSIFKKDVMAGLTVGILALPLAMAFAIASGVEPARGLYTAIIAGFLISALGGSRVQIGGPTGAFVVIIYGIIERSGYHGLCISTLLAAFLLILFGIFRVGSFIKYVPHPLVSGFTMGISILIFSTQIKDFFGLKMGTPPADFIAKWSAYTHSFSTWDPLTLSISAGTLALIVIIRRYIPALPWGISTIGLATAAALFFHLPIDTIFSRFGEIPKHLSLPHLSDFALGNLQWAQIAKDGITIAFLGGIESLLSAMMGDKMMGGRHRPNCELVAQGIANLGSILFGGIPATGAIARTATNIKTGAQTPVAGMIHALVLFLTLFYFSHLVSQIPLAALSAVLMVVAWNMSDMSHFLTLWKAPLGDRMIFLSALLLTIFVDITMAIFVGMTIACFFFMHKMSQKGKVVLSPLSSDKKAIYEIHGPFFFGTANILKDHLHSLQTIPKSLILNLGGVPMIDASGMYALKDFMEACKKEKISLCFSEIAPQIRQDFKRFGLLDKVQEVG